MSLKRATPIAHDGKTLIKLKPLRVTCLVCQGREFTSFHSGLDQTVAITGGQE